MTYIPIIDEMLDDIRPDKILKEVLPGPDKVIADLKELIGQ